MHRPLIFIALLLACNGGKDTADDTSSSTGQHHPDGYEAPEVHGLAAKLSEESCVECHAADLTGDGDAISCDSCHPAGWRTSCTFCHGGLNGDVDGLPPEDIDNETDEALISFGAHPEHADPGGIGHPAYSCDQCHVLPGGALAAGHAIDDTPGVAEVDLSGGLSWEGGYDPVVPDEPYGADR